MGEVISEHIISSGSVSSTFVIFMLRSYSFLNAGVLMRIFCFKCNLTKKFPQFWTYGVHSELRVLLLKRLHVQYSDFFWCLD
ncbi:hypothetical protein P8452_46599 [Trifolium repens]|nr:hypothetical protein P8452_46599 [Trifolium repens]